MPIVTIFVIIVWVASVCLHEFGHALVAYRGGDRTVKEKGYLSMNPLKYINPTMSIILPVIFLLLGGIGLPGGAVYIETWRLKSRWWDSAVSAAGPFATLIMALALASPFYLGIAGPAQDSWLWSALAFCVFLQVGSIILNLLPIPPLDGYGIIAPHLDAVTRAKMSRFGIYGILVVFGALFFFDPVRDLFWGTTFRITHALGVPPGYVVDGFNLFMFWRR